MGLAMYAIRMPKRLRKETDMEWEGNPTFHDWSCHPDLYRWLDRLYFQKGGKFDELAGSTVRLDACDINELERVLRCGKLPVFKRFPCVSHGYMLDDDLTFISKARDALSADFNVVVRATY